MKCSKRKWLRKGKSYRARDYILSLLGFSNYREYLSSPLWSEIRLKALNAAGWKCESCGEPANQVHHLIYHKAVLIGKNMSALKALCRGCHSMVEFDNEGKKLTVKGMRSRWRKMRKSAKRGQAVMELGSRIMDENAAHLRSIL